MGILDSLRGTIESAYMGNIGKEFGIQPGDPEAMVKAQTMFNALESGEAPAIKGMNPNTQMKALRKYMEWMLKQQAAQQAPPEVPLRAPPGR